MVRYRSRIVLLTLAALLPAGGTALAATPFTAGSGDSPSVAVASDGTGHVVWTTEGEPSRVGYCRLAAGGESCNHSMTLTFPGTGPAHRPGGIPRVFAPTATKIVIVAGCWNCGAGGATDRVFRWISNDGGTSFGDGVEIANVSKLAGFGTWLDDVGIFVAANASRVKAMGDAPAAGDGVEYATGGLFAYEAEVVRLPGTNKLVAAVNDLHVVKYGVFDGSLTVPAINTPANWLVDRTLVAAEGDNEDTALNAGPNGIYLTYVYFVPNDNRLGLRRFDPATNTFSAPTYVEGGDPIDNNSLGEADSFQDPSGRIHIMWRSLHDGGRLRYRATDTTGGALGAVGNLARKEIFESPEIAAGADGKGFAAWVNGSVGNIRIVPLDPQPEPAAPPTTTPPTTTPPVTTPPAFTGPFTNKTVNVPGATITFGFPGACVQPGQRFRVTLKWKKKKRKGNVFVKIRRTDFYIGTRRVKIDRKAPFRKTLTATASAARGSVITLRARAFIKVKRGRSPKKSIFARIRICP